MRFLAAVCLCAALAVVAAAEVPRAAPSRGRPVIRVFPSDECGFEGLCQSVTLDSEGRPWVAAMEPRMFDGVRWVGAPRTWIGPTLTVVCGGDGTLWVGGINQLGRVRPAPWRVESLTERLEGTERDVGRLLRGLRCAGGAVLWSSSGVVHCAGDTVRFRRIESGVKEVFLAAGVPHARGNDERIWRLEGNAWTLVAEARPDRWNLPGPVVVGAEAERWLAGQVVSMAVRLPDGGIAVGTRAAGLVRLGPDGEMLEHWTSDNGLPNDSCISLAVDAQGGVWIAHRRNAVATRLSVSTGLRLHGKPEGIVDTVLHSHQVGGVRHVQGGEALWRQEASGRFSRVTGTKGGGWISLEHEGEVWWAGKSAGRLTDQGYEPVPQLAGKDVRVWGAGFEPGTAYAGTLEGVFRLRRTAAGWSAPELVLAADGQDPSRLIELGDGLLWQGINWGNIRSVDLRQPLAERKARWLKDEPEGAALPAQQSGDLLFPLVFENTLVVATGGGFARWRDQHFEPWAEAAALLRPGQRGVRYAWSDGRILWWQERDGPSDFVRVERRGGKLVAQAIGGGVLRGFHTDTADAQGDPLWLAHGDTLAMLPAQAAPPAAVRARIDEVRGADETWLWGAGGTEAGCVLPRGRREVTLRYSATDFEADWKGRSGLEFRRRLTGAEEWSRWSREASRTYTNLQPGRLRFEVEARTLAGEILAASPLEIMVPAYWWETWWGLGGLWLGGAGLLAYGAARWAQRRLRERVRRLSVESALQQERLRIARDMHDGVGSGLGRLRLTLEQARKAAPAAERDALLERAGSTTEELAEQAREIIWAVTPENDTLDELLDRLAESVRRTAEAAGLRCRLELPAASQPRAIHAEARHQILLAVKEAAHNAVKHAQASELQLRAAVEDDRLALVIEDNGRGFQPEVGRAGGLGLGSLRARAEALRGRAEIDSRPDGGGTRVRLWFPLAAAAG